MEAEEHFLSYVLCDRAIAGHVTGQPVDHRLILPHEVGERGLVTPPRGGQRVLERICQRLQPPDLHLYVIRSRTAGECTALMGCGIGRRALDDAGLNGAPPKGSKRC